MNGSFGVSFLGVLSFIVSLAKEIVIIYLLIKVVQVLNIFIKDKKIPFTKAKCENTKSEDNTEPKENTDED